MKRENVDQIPISQLTPPYLTLTGELWSVYCEYLKKSTVL